MSAKDYKIEVFKRDRMGKRDVRKLRAEGYIPGIYYAADQPEPITFKMEKKELSAALADEALVYHVSVGGVRRNVLIKEIQYHPVTDEFMHVDFQGVSMDAMIEFAVPLVFIGKPIGVTDEGGQIHHGLMDVHILCIASEVPSSIELDISEVHLGESIHAGDLDIGKVELVTSPDATVITVARPKVVEEEVVEADEDEFVFDAEAPDEEAADDSEKSEEK